MTTPRRGCAGIVAMAITFVAGANLSAQCPDGSPPPCSRAAGRPTSAHSVAVLYLQSSSRDTADAGMADGLTEEIIARLSQVSGLRVASRYASQTYRGRRLADPRQVGRELRVRYVLDGTLRRAGQSLRVVLVITDATGGFNVWGQTYERPVNEIFSVEDSVAVQVAEAVLGRISAADRARLAPPPASASTDAYQAYLRGRVAIRDRTAAAATVAVTRYREAIALDPRFARAWAGLAHALALARDWGWAVSGVAADSVQPLATLAARQALALDSASADSWLAAAMATRAVDMDRALMLHRRAVATDSGGVEAIHQLAWGFLATGKLDSAQALERRAIARDPYYAFGYAGLGTMLNLSGHFADALAVLAQGMAVDSMNAPLYWQQADALLALGRLPEARAAADRAAALGFDSVGAEVLRAIARLRAGDTAAVRGELPDLERIAAADPVRSRGGLAYSRSRFLSALYAQLGDAAGAVRWAQQVPDWPRRYYAVLFGRHWFWEPVRSDPRFQALLAALRT